MTITSIIEKIILHENTNGILKKKRFKPHIHISHLSRFDSTQKNSYLN